MAAQNGVLLNGGDVNSNGTSLNKETAASSSSNGNHHHSVVHNGNGYATQNGGSNGKPSNGYVADRLIDTELTQRKVQK